MGAGAKGRAVYSMMIIHFGFILMWYTFLNLTNTFVAGLSVTEHFSLNLGLAARALRFALMEGRTLCSK